MPDRRRIRESGVLRNNLPARHNGEHSCFPTQGDPPVVQHRPRNGGAHALRVYSRETGPGVGHRYGEQTMVQQMGGRVTTDHRSLESGRCHRQLRLSYMVAGETHQVDEPWIEHVGQRFSPRPGLKAPSGRIANDDLKASPFSFTRKLYTPRWWKVADQFTQNSRFRGMDYVRFQRQGPKDLHQVVMAE